MRTQSDSGAGALLGAAAGDQRGAEKRRDREVPLYGWFTQSMTLTAYEILSTGALDAERLRSAMSRFADSDDGNLFRGTPEALLDASSPATLSARAIPIALWWRREPSGLVDAMRVGAGPDIDLDGHLASAAYGAAVAAASFGQLGVDYLNAVVEVSRSAEDMLAGGSRELSGWLSGATSMLTAPVADVVGLGEESGVPLPAVAVVLGAAAWGDSHDVVEAAAATEVDCLAALVGGITGSRWGIGTWPWDVPNASWFAELGRRLSMQQQSIVDLPQPVAVEAFLASEGPGVV